MACCSRVPSIVLNNGHKIPMIGLGTWRADRRRAAQAVKDAIDSGYRHIDCAFLYKNEKQVGEGIAHKLAEGAVTREDLFVTGKLWNTYHRPDLVGGAFGQSLRELGLCYLDLYLMHSPMAYKEYDDVVPRRNGKVLYSRVDFVETWKAMEQLVLRGLVRSIGVSNFNRKQIERLLACASVCPVVNQVECHPYLNQRKLLQFCISRGIAVTGFSPLGSPHRPGTNKADPILLYDPVLREVSLKYKKTPAQIALRYQIQRGVVVIPKSVTKSRIRENVDVLDFELSSADVETINCLDKNKRFISFDDSRDHPDYPFGDEY